MERLKIEVVELDNGLKSLIVDTKTFPSFTALLLVKVGSRYETSKNNGIAHFFEHMAFKGSKKYPDAFKLSSTIEGIGGKFNAFTSKDSTGYWIKAPTKHMDLVFDVLSDMIKSPLLREEDIDKERKVVVEEINMNEDEPRYRVWKAFFKLVFGEHPLGYPILGPKENILSFTRKDFLDYLSKWYFPSNAYFVVAGGLSGIDVKSKINKVFADWRKEKKNNKLDKFIDSQTQPAFKFIKDDTQQAHLLVGFKGLSLYDEDRYALSIGSGILGKGMSSRLFQKLREEKGWCYYVNSRTLFFEDTGVFFMGAGITIKKPNIEEAVKIMLSEVESIAQGKISKEEIKRQKEYAKGTFLLDLEDSFNLAYEVGSHYMIYKEKMELEKELAKIENVRKEDIVRAFKKVVDFKKVNIAVISPFESFSFGL